MTAATELLAQLSRAARSAMEQVVAVEILAGELAAVLDPPAPADPRARPGAVGRVQTHVGTYGTVLGEVPKIYQTQNLDKTRPTLAGTTMANQIDDALEMWSTPERRAQLHIDPVRHTDGPLLVMTVPLCWRGGNAKDTSPGPSSNVLTAYAGMLEVAEGGHDDVYLAIGQAIAAKGAGDWTILRPGHESQPGEWYTWAATVNKRLAGVIAEDLDPGRIGDRGPTFAKASRRCAEIIGNVPGCEKVAFDWNLSMPSADPDGTGEGVFPEISETGFPGRDHCQIVGFDYYGNPGQPVHGPGSRLQAAQIEHTRLATKFGLGMSCPEFAARLHVDPARPSKNGVRDVDAAGFIYDMASFIQRSPIVYATLWAASKVDTKSGGAGHTYRASAKHYPLYFQAVNDCFG